MRRFGASRRSCGREARRTVRPLGLETGARGDLPGRASGSIAIGISGLLAGGDGCLVFGKDFVGGGLARSRVRRADRRRHRGCATTRSSLRVLAGVWSASSCSPGCGRRAVRDCGCAYCRCPTSTLVALAAFSAGDAPARRCVHRPARPARGPRHRLLPVRRARLACRRSGLRVRAVRAVACAPEHSESPVDHGPRKCGKHLGVSSACLRRLPVVPSNFGCNIPG